MCYIIVMEVFVSIHAPVKVRLRPNAYFKRKFGFNSRTREGATAVIPETIGVARVSIHAPVKVRRYCAGCRVDRTFVSIHAPVKVRP